MESNKRPLASAFATSSPHKQQRTNNSALSTPIFDRAPPTVPNTGMTSMLNSPNGRKSKLSKLKLKTATLNDPIHGSIQLNGVCLEIVDTKEYQRLRDLKQLGTCNYVYSASHSRFEHSVGVGHLAECMVKRFQTNQPDLNITETDILCVKIAGLCHDLGHGPFSHVFDGVFMKRMCPNSHWRHEDGSVNMFRYLLQENNIILSEYNLSPLDQTFIEEIIGGVEESQRKGRPAEKFYLYDVVNNTRSGLDVDKLDYFQRDMKYTNAAHSSKFDRILELGVIKRAQPIIKAGGSNSTNSSQVIKSAGKSLFASVQEGSDALSIAQQEHEENPYMICYPEKLVKEAVEVFALRFRLHQMVYTHKSVKKIEFMITDALELADPFVKIPGSVTATHPDGAYKMSECISDPKALSNLSDSILYLIETSTDPNLKPAQELLSKVKKRQLYTCLGRSVYKRGQAMDRKKESDIAEEMVQMSRQMAEQAEEDQATDEFNAEEEYSNIQSQDSFQNFVVHKPSHHRSNGLKRISSVNSTSSVTGGSRRPVVLETNDIIVEKMNIHFGQKDKNPVDNMRFFPKNCPPDKVAYQLSEDSYETALPRVFEECAVRVFCREGRKDWHAREVFSKWCHKYESRSPFPSLSQQAHHLESDEEEDDEDQMFGNQNQSNNEISFDNGSLGCDNHYPMQPQQQRGEDEGEQETGGQGLFGV